ncbi:MAG: ribosome silencing factor [Candidatus Zixiibacteriota bacterium]|nr:MAG: ribosome silencing factor [candidate division Zixibacteria bacterium]
MNVPKETTTPRSKKTSSLALARQAGHLALEKKGVDVRILKLKALSSVCDYFVIVSGEADVHVKAIANGILDGLRKLGHRPLHREGMNEGNWILLDYADVVIHVFQEPTRRFYALEKLWGDAPVEIIGDAP